MGIFDRNRSTKYESQPNPANWTLVRHYNCNQGCALWLVYPNCTNYEGNKILVFKGVQSSVVLNQKEIDPHFSDSYDKNYPFARFAPTEDGWKHALAVLAESW